MLLSIQEARLPQRDRATLYTVSQKNVPPLACYNFDTREWILIFLPEMLPIK